jgi:hypothetical protein
VDKKEQKNFKDSFRTLAWKQTDLCLIFVENAKKVKNQLALLYRHKSQFSIMHELTVRGQLESINAQYSTVYTVNK